MSAVSAYTIVRSHTATHLSNAIAGAITEILTQLGISALTLASNWDQSYGPAIRAWIEEGALGVVIVECHRPGGDVEPIFEFPVEYTSDGSAGFSHRHLALARHWAKFSRVPAGTTFVIRCGYRFPPTDLHGWTWGTRASTAGLRGVTLGTLAAGPHAAASIRAYTR